MCSAWLPSVAPPELPASDLSQFRSPLELERHWLFLGTLSGCMTSEGIEGERERGRRGRVEFPTSHNDN